MLSVEYKKRSEVVFLEKIYVLLTIFYYAHDVNWRFVVELIKRIFVDKIFVNPNGHIDSNVRVRLFRMILANVL